MAYVDTNMNGTTILRVTATETSVNVAGNYSTVAWSIQIIRGNYFSYTNTPTPYTFLINGTVLSGSFIFDLRSASYAVIAEGTFNVAHDSDGSKNVYVEGSVGNTGTAIGGPATVGMWLGLTTIARATQPSMPVEVTAGTAVTILTPRASTGYYNRVVWAYGSTFGLVGDNVHDSVSWTPSIATTAPLMPNTTRAGGWYIRVYTYEFPSNRLIGERDFYFNMNLPASVKPVVAAINPAEGTAAVTAAGIGAYVAGISKLSVASNVSTAYSSPLVSVRVAFDGQTLPTNAGTFPNAMRAGTYDVVVTATDTRGRVGTRTESVTVLPYSPPQLGPLAPPVRTTVAGAESQTGTYTRITFNSTAQSLVVGGVQKNTLRIRILSRLRGASAWVEKSNTTGALSRLEDQIIGTYALESSADIRIELIDALATTTQQLVLATATILQHWNGRAGIGIGKFHENGMLDVAGDIYSAGANLSKRANTLKGTSAERVGATGADLAAGTMWSDTSTGQTFTRRGGAWTPLREMVSDDYATISTGALNTGATVLGTRTFPALPYATVLYVDFAGSFFANTAAGGRRLVGNVSGGAMVANPSTNVQCASSVDTPYAWKARITIAANTACQFSLALNGTANATNVRGLYVAQRFMA